MLKRLLPALTAAVSGCLLLPIPALGADSERTPLELAGPSARSAAEGGGAGPGGGGLVRTIVGLAIVIGVIYGLNWLLKQVKTSKEDDRSGSGLGTLATLPLGPNRSLHLIRAGSELVLVGTGEHGVTPIRTYSEAEARELGLLDGELDTAGADGEASAAPPLAPPARLWRPAGLVRQLRARTVIK